MNKSAIVGCSSMVLALLAASCSMSTDQSHHADAVESSEDGLVSTTQPYACQPSALDLLALTKASGQFTLKGKLGTEKAATGNFSMGPDLPNAPAGGVSTHDSWESQQAGATCAGLTPNHGDRLHQALAAADSHLVIDSSTLTSKFDDLKQFLAATGVNLYVTPTTHAPNFHGYEAERARWLRSQYVRTTTTPIKDVNNVYLEPAELKDLRQQAGRMYCAFKEAHNQQGTHTHVMGTLPAFSVKVLGSRIDFLVVKPTVALGAPQKFVGAGADGTEAFMVPMKFGNTIIPVDGIGLPGIDEVRAPVALVSGDAEFTQKAMYTDLYSTTKTPAGQTISYTWKGYRKDYQTVVHSDAIMTHGQHAVASTSFPLMFIGPVEVKSGFKVTISTGDSVAANDRVMVNSYPYQSFPGGYRTGWGGMAGSFGFHDGAWTTYGGNGTTYVPAGFQILPEGSSNPAFRLPFAEIGPMVTRGQQDDDRHVDTTTNLALEMSLGAHLGFNFGPLIVSLGAGGSITGDVTQHHEMREALWGQSDPSKSRMLAVNGVSVRPRTSAKIDVNPLTVGMHFRLPIPFFDDIEWDATLLNMSTLNLANYDSDENKAWKESAHMRVGYGSESGDSMKSPAVRSHLPGDEPFSSMPVGVDQCLAEPAPEAYFPKECQAPAPKGAPPRAEMCAYTVFRSLSISGTVAPPTHICENKPAMAQKLALGPQLQACTQNVLNYLCDPSTFEFSDADKTTLSHFASTEAELAEAGNLLLACGIAARDAGQYTPDQAKEWIQRLIQFAPCDANGRILSPEEVMMPLGDPATAPVPTGPEVCQ